MKLQESPCPCVASASPRDEVSLFDWTVWLLGPPSSPYNGYKYKLRVQLPEDYPNAAPTIMFETPIWHPAVSIEGKVCELMFADWRGTMTIADALTMVFYVLEDTKGIMNVEAAKMVKEDVKQFWVKAAQHAAKKGVGV